jgi:hypothetical protein
MRDGSASLARRHRSRLPGLLLGLTMLGAGCSHAMEASIDIDAGAPLVWRALTELDAYPQWNPFFVTARGELRPDAKLTLTMKPVGKSPVDFSPLILEVQPQRHIVWRGRLVMPGLFDGTHQFIIEPLAADRVRFTQQESFRGLFVPFLDYEPFLAGWRRMNEALKRRAEAWQAAERARPAAASD